MTDDDRQDYLAYMVRLWRIEGEGQPVWRASVECPHTGERQAFATLRLLFAYLEAQALHRRP